MEKYKLNGQVYESKQSKITGELILANAGLAPKEDFELLIKVNEKGREPIQLDEIVDLKEPGIEGFIAKPYKKLLIFIDDEQVEVEECFLTPVEILEKISKDSKKYYLKQLRGDIEVGYKRDQEHKIAIKNGAKFISCRTDSKKVNIIVNGTAEEVDKGDISYNEIVILAFPDFPQHPERTYSVTYEKGQASKPSGILSPGGAVTVKNRMVFKVKHTGQS